MSVFTINEIKFLKSKDGSKSYAKAKMTDGKEYTIWGDFENFNSLAAGQTINGEVRIGSYMGKEQYTLYKDKATQFTPKSSNMTKVMEKKNEYIKEAQETKNENIKVSSTFRDATILTQVWATKADMPFLTSEDIQTKWLEFRQWLFNNFDKDTMAPF